MRCRADEVIRHPPAGDQTGKLSSREVEGLDRLARRANSFSWCKKFPKIQFPLPGRGGTFRPPAHKCQLGEVRGDKKLIRLGTQILDWMWTRGWDDEFGGIYYFRGVFGGAGAGILARHEMLVAAQRDDHRHPTRLETHR